MKNALLLLTIVLLCCPPAANAGWAKKMKRVYEAALEGARAGNCEDMVLLGSMICKDTADDFYHSIHNTAEGLAWLQKAEEKGCPRASYELAVGMLESNDTSMFDAVIAALTRSAAGGSTEALYKMGMIYMYGGSGLPATKYISSAGNLLESDTKPHYDLEKAGQYFQQAAAKGHAAAAAQLDIARAVGDDPRSKGIIAYNQRDYATALRYFVYAWVGKDPLAMIYLGNMYSLGLGVKQDNFFPTQSFYRQAGYNGMPIGFYMAGQLGERFGGHEGWQKDNWMDAYKEGAKRGSEECQAALERVKRQDEANFKDWVNQHALAREARMAEQARAPEPPKKTTFQWGTNSSNADADRRLKAESDYDKAAQRHLEQVIGNGR